MRHRPQWCRLSCCRIARTLNRSNPNYFHSSVSQFIILLTSLLPSKLKVAALGTEYSVSAMRWTTVIPSRFKCRHSNGPWSFTSTICRNIVPFLRVSIGRSMSSCLRNQSTKSINPLAPLTPSQLPATLTFRIFPDIGSCWRRPLWSHLWSTDCWRSTWTGSIVILDLSPVSCDSMALMCTSTWWTAVRVCRSNRQHTQWILY